jgi:hypothetical protein
MKSGFKAGKALLELGEDSELACGREGLQLPAKAEHTVCQRY